MFSRSRGTNASSQQAFKNFEIELRKEIQELIKSNGDLYVHLLFWETYSKILCRSSSNCSLRESLTKSEEQLKGFVDQLKASVPIAVMDKQCQKLQDDLQRSIQEAKCTYDR